jgi:hypothetical protein
MMPAGAFPRLTSSNYHVTSPANGDYNCIAWSAGDTEHWWQPNVFWPIQAPPNEYGIAVLQQLFTALGYEDCSRDVQSEPGFEKVALFGDSIFYTHAARQLPTGKWTSKLGHAEDIEHDTPQDVAGGIYGDLVQVMKRAVP